MASNKLPMLVSVPKTPQKPNTFRPNLKTRYITSHRFRPISFQVRSFSTGNVSQQLIKPPVQVFGIEGRYATALYSAATKQKSLDGVQKDLAKVQQAMKSDAGLREFILNPTIKRKDKAEGLKAVASKISLNPQTSFLLQIMAENGRLKKLDAVVNAFSTIMAAHRGEVRLLQFK